MFIYGLKDPATQKIRYIGATKNLKKRFLTHLTSKPNTHKGSWIVSLKRRNLNPELVILREVEASEWKMAEVEYIRKYRGLGYDLTNSTDGGDGVTNLPLEIRERIKRANMGKVISEETRQRLKESHIGQKPWNKGKIGCGKGRIVFEETRKKIRATMTGQKHSMERVEANRLSHLGQPAWNKGRRFSIEARKKMSEAHKGKTPWNKGKREEKQGQQGNIRITTIKI